MERNPHLKYRKVQITKDLTWSAHTKMVVKKALFFFSQNEEVQISVSPPHLLLQANYEKHRDRQHHCVVRKPHRSGLQRPEKGGVISWVYYCWTSTRQSTWISYQSCISKTAMCHIVLIVPSTGSLWHSYAFLFFPTQHQGGCIGALCLILCFGEKKNNRNLFSCVMCLVSTNTWLQ